MKKQNVIAALGTVTLIANLLVPGMAFGQGTGDQTASQTINCTSSGTLTLQDTPDNMSFDTLTASPAAQDSFDSDVTNDTSLPDAHLLGIFDTRSGRVDGCPVTTPGFTVTAQITQTLTTGSDTIPDSSFRVITSNESAAPIACTTETGNDVCYQFAPGPGNAHDVSAPFLYDDFARDPGITFAAFRAAAIYKNAIASGDSETTPTGPAFLNTLDAPVTILSTGSGHNGNIFTSTVLYGNIPAGQGPGVYSGRITYTLAAA